MMSYSERNNRFPFTASQWQELEQQALVFKYMASGIPIPPDLIFTVRSSLDSSLSSKLLLHQSPQLGWNGFHMGGFGRKIDPEPGRCRRTDGKKWRCSKDAYPDSKYCERHMHRGRNRSRKPVENIMSPPEKSSMNNNTLSEPRFLYDPNFSTTRSPGLIGFSSSQENNATTKSFLESNAYTRSPHKAYRNRQYGDGMEGEKDSEHAFVSEAQLSTMGFSLSQLKENNKAYSSSSSGLENGSQQNLQNHYYNNIERDNNINDEAPAKKVMHHFLDEWPPKHKSDSNWPNHSHQDNFSITNRNNTQLSKSIPNSLHDFFNS